MKFIQSLQAFAALAILTNARKPSKFSQDRIAKIWEKMERHYGKGLVGMFHPVTGRFDPNRVGWARHGRKLGESFGVDYQITDSLRIDGTTGASLLMGAAQGTQWDGLNSNTAADSLTSSGEQLSNCFASTYANLESFDQLAYDWENITAQAGSWGGMDVFINDPTKILADNVVTYEMCDFGTITAQAKLMSSLDWSSLSDNLVRETMVLAIELPETLDLQNQIAQAGKCANAAAEGAIASAGAITDETLDQSQKIAKEAIELEEEALKQAKLAEEEAKRKAKEAEKKANEEKNKVDGDDKKDDKKKDKENQDDFEDDNEGGDVDDRELEWWELSTDVGSRVGQSDDKQADKDSSEDGPSTDGLEDGVNESIDGVTDSIDGITDGATDAANDALKEAANCLDIVDNFAIGQLGGKVFKNFFNNGVKPLN